MNRSSRAVLSTSILISLSGTAAFAQSVISAHSDARHEVYFRREWRLAVERAGDMSDRGP